jgi:hypothetical protein
MYTCFSASTLAILLLFNSTTPSPIKGACGTTSPEARTCCLGSMDVPRRQQQLFIDGSRKAIDILYSQEFADNLARYVATLPDSYKQQSAWKNVDAQQTVQELRKKVCGLNITTYGGPRGLWVKVFSGNIAYDGEGSDPNSPIRINRWGLANRTAEQVANTIAHEAAHRVGLHHPSSGKDLIAANCEPPYIIGDLVEALAKGKKWDPNTYSCYGKILTRQ